MEYLKWHILFVSRLWRGTDEYFIQSVKAEELVVNVLQKRQADTRMISNVA